MIYRYISSTAFSKLFSRQMRFISGPRQCGKTTIAKAHLAKLNCSAFYYNWDRREVRTRYRLENDFLHHDLLNSPSQSSKRYWVCFDEIHKMPKWKNILKDFFDSHEKEINFIITGSARLDMFKRSGDSLAGRYFLFRLNPFLLSELCGRKLETVLPEKHAIDYIEKSIAHKKHEQKAMESMLKLSSFPEPLLKNNSLFARKWHESYMEKIVKEDLRDLSSIHQMEKVIDLIYLLSAGISSPLSIKSLKEELELNFNTVKNYINYLMLVFVLFQIPPYHKSMKRVIRKEKKAYFYDISPVQNEAARFENYIALELKIRIDLWNDIQQDKYDLFFFRTREGKETDFVITKNGAPYFLCEAKLSSTNIDKHHYIHAHLLGDIPFIQVLKEPNVLKIEQKKHFVISASRFFS
ncbi:MAG: AAA family ATPase [bacterium]